jgi:hypothetical protein
MLISNIFVHKNGKIDLSTIERFKQLLEIKGKLKEELSSCCHLEVLRSFKGIELVFSELTSFNPDFVKKWAKKENDFFTRRMTAPVRAPPAAPPAAPTAAPTAAPPSPAANLAAHPYTPAATVRSPSQNPPFRPKKRKNFKDLCHKSKRNICSEICHYLVQKYGYNTCNHTCYNTCKYLFRNRKY